MKEFILASQSPRRKQLLEWAELNFEIIVQSTDESYPADLPIDQVPVHIARQKALAVKTHVQTAFHKQYAAMPILAADTIVVLNGKVIGKPIDKEDAIQILESLSGQLHQVITGVVLMNGDQEIAFSDTTEVKFYPLTHTQISNYVDKYQPYDKAGAYAIQEWIGVVGIESIKGDFYNVMGLPVSRVVKALEHL
ncbi:MAG: septum formation protein Maf [Bacteroidetes bacterium 24-39-8]|jgi:septum formation protein|nr:MAG: septum formation protein Maf [Sphingobacteriia bacterium 35-40-8]OYZ49028.1 MAG: septum formation protein Maf [Bacteroidetes bacterium 24-39-8]OZA66953.1 MAG: septum formation protein Maf [Sphingobacteriia bacterium 39-39-8]HQR93199.1 Maf family protein [Sediminibacterium sp.]HQS54173.1 Maf family protein [Sediminibacterium sp.]